MLGLGSQGGVLRNTQSLRPKIGVVTSQVPAQAALLDAAR